MPELPEVEITARLLDGALRGSRIESALAPGINALKSFAPPLEDLAGQEVLAVRRRGKQLIVDAGGERSLLIHLMSAGRLQVFDRRAALRDRTSRLLVRMADGRELRLREFGTRQRAWVKLLPTPVLGEEESLAGLGPEAWPDPPPLGPLLAAPRPLHSLLRDQHVIAGIGRSFADEILWRAMLSPYKRGDDLGDAEAHELREAVIEVLGHAVEHLERELRIPIPDKFPLPLRIHRHEGSPCPRCHTTLQAVHFEDYVIAYCPHCQTGERILKDRRLSRLLK